MRRCAVRQYSFWLCTTSVLASLSTGHAFRLGGHCLKSVTKFSCGTQQESPRLSLFTRVSPRRPSLTRTQLAADSSGPDPSVLISSKDDRTQQLAFATAFAVLAAGTTLCIQLWQGPGVAILGSDFYENIRGTVFPIVFGTIFAIVGILHFIFVENFARIVPPIGTWGGLWQAPSPFQKILGISYGAYHSYWTGIAETAGGIWLLAGGLGFTPVEAPAMLLFLLTVGVTPANLYMFTHDATPGGSVPRLAYPAGHIARFVVQCGLLSNFWIMANP